MPFLAHAPMEPMNATVHCKPDFCEIWTGTQVMTRVQSEAAKAAGLPVEKVTVNNHLIGGGFGRRLEPDMVVAAVRIAKQRRRAGEGGMDARGGHPARHLSAGLSRHHRRDPVGRQDRGLEISYHRFVGDGALAAAGLRERHGFRRVDSAVDIPYDIPNFHVEYVRAEPPGGADRLLARRRTEQQRVRDRMLHGRAGAQGRQGSGRIPPLDAWQPSRGCRPR